VGVGAVVLDAGRVLLVRRGQEPLKGEWSIPGGVLELGEMLEDGVRREVAEETGLDVRVVKVVEVVDRIVFESNGPEADAVASSRVRYHYVLVDFLCTPAGGVLRCGTDAVEARWVSREELHSPGMGPMWSATIAVIEKGFAMGASEFRRADEPLS